MVLAKILFNAAPESIVSVVFPQSKNTFKFNQKFTSVKIFIIVSNKQ